MVMTMAGTQTPQKLFGDFASSTKGIPGMVTPEITAAMPSMVDWNAIAATQNASRAQQSTGWGAAEFNAEQAAKQRAAQQEAEKQKLRAAFNEVYGPQLQSAYHDRMVAAEKTPGSGVPNPYRGQTHEPARWSSSNPSTTQTFDQYMADKGGTYKMGELDLRKQLDNMWRMQTDPYLRAVSGTTASPSDMIRMMHPGGSVGGSNPAAWALNQDGGGGGGGGRTRQAESINPFPAQSLRERVSPGPQFKYDMWGGQ